MNKNLKKLILSALFLALALVLPLLTGQIKEIGNALCPMHIPVLLCGYICGPLYAVTVGIIAPLLRFLIFGMPPVMPNGIGMCFELLTYGLISGLLYKIFPKKKIYIYISLIAAMLSGRIVWGIVRAFLASVGGSAFALSAFIAGAFSEAIPGIVLQIILIPVLVIAAEKVIKNKNI